MIEYPRQTKIPKYFAKYRIAEYILEDLPMGDCTTEAIFDCDHKSTAVIQAEENIIFAGGELISYFFNDSFDLKMFFHDGQFVKSGEIIARIHGATSQILGLERAILNLIQRLSGIATLTNQYVQIAQPYNVKILDTRKTTPGMRLFEKYAVAVGGGYNHRLDLSSGILIKDNHIKAAGSIQQAINKIRMRFTNMPIELEVENLEQIKEGLNADVDGFLLDNMSPKNCADYVRFIREYSDNDIFIEASGNMNLERLPMYVTTGVDAISVGALTHSVKAANIHLEFE